MSAKKVIGSVLLVMGVGTIGIFLFLFIGMFNALEGDLSNFFSLFGTPIGWIFFGIPFFGCVVPGFLLVTSSNRNY